MFTLKNLARKRLTENQTSKLYTMIGDIIIDYFTSSGSHYQFDLRQAPVERKLP